MKIKLVGLVMMTLAAAPAFAEKPSWAGKGKPTMEQKEVHRSAMEAKGDDIDTTSYGVSGEWFMTNNFSISLSYVRTEIDIELPSFTPAPYRGIDFTSSTVFEDSSNDADIDAFSLGVRLGF